ncbi:hypothetical protein LFL97_33975 [Burkholderia sp. JSH-S8]|nr:hypothetical protein LFL97_33975 [Burkholderia sp. JSH-S8]
MKRQLVSAVHMPNGFRRPVTGFRRWPDRPCVSASAAKTLSISPLFPRLAKDKRAPLATEALKLIPAATVRANEVDAERVDIRLSRLKRHFLTALNAHPIHDDAYFGEAEHEFRLKSNRVSGGR